MLPLMISPARHFARSRLFATTALISLAGLPGVARADMDLDDSRLSWGWSSISQIWLDANGDHQALPDDDTGIITGQADVRRQLRIIGTVEAAGLTLGGGDFRIYGGTLAAGSASLALAAGTGTRFFIDSDISGDVVVSGNGQVVLRGDGDGDITVTANGSLLMERGETTGNMVNNGEVNLSADRTGDITNNGLLGLGGTLTGDLTNSAGDRVNLRGTVDGLVENDGNLFVVDDSGMRDLNNNASGTLDVMAGHRLDVVNEVQNAGDISVSGELAADVANAAGSSVTLAGGTLAGDLENAGTLTGAGTVTGAVGNTGTVTTGGALTVGSLVNDGQVTVRAGDSLASTDAALLNNDALTVNGSLTGGLDNSATGTVAMGANGNISGRVDNAGSLTVAGRIQGRVENDASLTTSGNVRITELNNNAGATMTVGASHTMTVDQQVQNAGIAAINGTLAGDMHNTGTANLNGGTVTGALENDGTLNARGSIGGTLDNDATLNLTGNLQVGRLDNAGTTNVGLGETLTATQRIDNSNAMNIDGTVTVDGATGLQNNASGTITLNGAEVNANLTNRGTLLVNSSSQVNGDLTNRNQLTLDGTAGDVTLSVDGVFTNSGRVDGTNTSGTPSAMTIVADLVAVESGAVVNNVNVIGDLLNRSILTYDQDSFLDGNLTNDSSGEVTVSAALDVRGNDIGNLGDFHITTDADSSGALNGVGALSNEGTLTIDAGTSASAQSVRNHDDGVMNVAGTLTSATAVENEAALNLSGRIAGGLDNSGVTTLTAGTVAGSVANSGTLRGTGTVTGGVTNSGTMAMSGTVAGTVTNNGTLNQTGTLGVAGLVNNDTVTIAAGGVLNATGTVQNNDHLTVAGQLAGTVQNGDRGILTIEGGTVTGPISNLGLVAGNGTVSGTLNNSGLVTISGRLNGGLVNSNVGMLVTQGRLSTASLSSAGRIDVSAGSTLQSDTAVQNSAELRVAGRLEAAVANTGNVAMNGGTIAGAVTNDGTLNGAGTIEGRLANNASAVMGGRVTGAVTNAGTLTSSGTLRVGSLVNDEVLNVAAGSTLRSDGTLTNNDRVTLAGRVEGTLDNLGTTTLAGGTLAGRLQNGGTLTGTGTVNGTLANAGNATIAGRVDALQNTGTLALAGDLAVGTLVNDALVTVGADHRLGLDDGMLNNDRLLLAGTLAGGLDNRGTTTLAGGTIEGDVGNRGSVTGGGRVTGQLVNEGTLSTDRRLSIGRLINNQTASVAEGGVLVSGETVQNRGEFGIAGRLEADLVNAAAGTATLAGGTIAGDVGNLGRLTGTGTIDGTLQNGGSATLGGIVGAVQNLQAGQFAVAGTLTTEGFVNAGAATIGAGTRLVMADPDAQAAPVAAQNLDSGTLTVNGTLQGALVNAGTLGGAGTITGPVLNTGSANWAGRIQGSVTNRAALTLAGGTIGGSLINEAGNFVSQGATTVSGGISNQSGATARIAIGSTLTATGGLLNQAGGTLFLNGRLTGDVDNRGAMTQTGTLEGSVATLGRMTLSGAVTGDLIYDGGTLVLRDGASIGRDFRLNADYAVGAGSTVAAARTVVSAGTTLALAGLLDGALLNQGRVAVAGNRARVAGTLTNAAEVDMTDGSTAGVFRVGGLDGSGTYRLDLNLRTMTSDRIEILGGAAHGAYHLEFDLADRDTLPQRGARVTLIDVDDSYGSQNDFSYTRSELPAGSERIVYSVQRAGSDGAGDLELVSQLNPAMGAIFGNVALVQSLIGSVVNRPTSPFVTALAYEDSEKPCGIGSWGRVIGGHATASGRTDNGISNVETEVNADYYGMQVGTDFACFDNRFGGWNMAFGALAGLNRGSTSQPVYAIDPNNSQDLTAILTSYTSTDFEQRYAGLYATATRGRFQADLQYRVERTDFTIANDPLPGYTGLGLEETDFSSDTRTLSGSVSYGFPIADSGWAVLPTMGFAWSKLSTDSIRFDEDYSLIFKDSTRKIGFAGATVAKTFVDNGRNSALYAFATGTWYKDFADPTISLFASEDNTETLTTENLGSYGEVSVGANWIKVLGPKAKGRQISAGARIDARFGDQLDSVGVSGQFRWQF